MSASRTNRNNRERGKAFELKVANFMGFFRVPLSGSAEVFGLGDVRDVESQEDSLTIGECKSITPRNAREVNYPIKEEWFIGKNGIVGKAGKKGKMPWLSFTKVRSTLWYVVILPRHFRMFLRAIQLLRDEGVVDNTKNIDQLQLQIDTLWEARHGKSEADNSSELIDTDSE